MLSVLMAASEAMPFAKTGGLADVLGALPRALAERGNRIGVILPMYRTTRDWTESAPRIYENMTVWIGSSARVVHIRHVRHAAVDYYFVEAPEFFDRDTLYGPGGTDYPDNPLRFAVFSRAVLQTIRHIFRPQIVHCHDWQSSLIPPLMRHTFAGDPTFMGLRLILTIHNLGYQGIFPKEVLAGIGMDESLARPEALEFWGKVNFLKGGIVFSDSITTVSRAYAREIQSEELGFGLDGLLRSRSADLRGILNGVDYSEWSPETDRFLAQPYSASDLAGKQVNKRKLLELFGLPENLDRPLIGIVSRLADQKGFDLVEEIAPELLAEDISLAVVGSGEPRFEQFFQELALSHPDKVGVRIGYDEALAHQVEAGADIFLMPSRYEPCGLNQIYSLRYGTVPVVRATGGLDDTIDEANGFKFSGYAGNELMGSIRAALAAYADPARWKRLVAHGMQQDFSWDSSAREYENLYRRVAA